MGSPGDLSGRRAGDRRGGERKPALVAPAGQGGGITGGVLSFTAIATMIYPAIYGIILASTGSYEIGFALGSIPAFVAFVIFLNPPLQRSWLGFAMQTAVRLASPAALLRLLGIAGAGLAFGLAFHAIGG